MQNYLRHLLNTKSDALIGAVINLQDPASVEIAGLAGFDFVFIEMEHSPNTTSDMLAHVRAARAAQIGSLARLPATDLNAILRMLDAGLEGILLAGADGVETARKAVAACRYAPIGTRGVGGASRAADYGGHGLKLGDFLEDKNRETVVGVLVEEPGAIAEIDNIVAIEGIDFIFIGPADLSLSMGLAGTSAHPKVVESVERVVASCKLRDLPFGLPLSHPAYPKDATELRDLGTRVIVGGVDTATLLAGFRAAAARARPPE
jgi:4-hydroxy-2-oxoheptanedioate aldolase